MHIYIMYIYTIVNPPLHKCAKLTEAPLSFVMCNLSESSKCNVVRGAMPSFKEVKISYKISVAVQFLCMAHLILGVNGYFIN